MIRALWHIALLVLSGLAAWLLIVVALVYCGPLLTIVALLFLTAFAAWRGRVRGPTLDVAAIEAAHREARDQGQAAAEVAEGVFRHYEERYGEPTPGRERIGL